MAEQYKKQSKYLSFILRHHPEELGLSLDSEGWANVAELLEKTAWTMEMLETIVDTDNKQRYSFNEDKTMIRANYGHSNREVNITMHEVTANELESLGGVLYHGTATRFMDSINSEGLKKMQRNYVHLSKDLDTAVNVGKRHGKVVVIKIKALEMLKDGNKIYRSENGVYLTDYVGTRYFGEIINMEI